jgi:hypothetical protein
MENTMTGSIDLVDIKTLGFLSERHTEGAAYHPTSWPGKICNNSHNHASIWPGYGRVVCPDCQRVYVNK